MTVKFDTRGIPVADREEVVRATVSRTLVPLEIDYPPDRGPVTTKLAISDLTELTVWSVATTAVKVQYTASPHDDITPSLILGLQLTGSCVVTQRDHEIALRPGDLAVWDSTDPFVIVDGNGLAQHKFRIPLDRLALPIDVIRQISAVRLCPDHPISDLAVAYFQRLASRPGAFDRPGGELVSQPGIDLLRAAITTHLDAAELGKEALQATLFVRVMDYVQSHVQEPDLNAGRIAAEHHISVRQLYRILAAEGVSLGDWMRTRRLEGARRDLALAFLHDPVSAVARRWGFIDASSFARMFRATYGVSPSEWREYARQATA
ncbi:helix-turn-helix domain-containing protein [Mycolicibacterium sp. Dal123E01]|uniref:helix-turn-helix domain-containing protein n=1 Tax=Mycolicibacterium sp. Dal123E01 TaxID=3457578 RepID=UPI00403E4ED6